MSGDSWNEGIRVQGKPEPHSGDNWDATWTRITPGFFATLGNPIVMGRPITEHDTATSPLVVVVNEAFAQKFFKGENPIGKHFGLNEMSHAGDYEVVGIAADMRYLNYDFKEPDRAMFFLPAVQHTRYTKEAEIAGENEAHYLTNLVLSVTGKPDHLETQVRSARSEISQPDMIAKLTLMFGGLALILAAVGLYGVTAYTVEQRLSEVGIRMAVGADRSSVLTMVLLAAFSQIGIGLAIGVPAATGAGRLIANQLYEVKPYDPAVLILAVLALGGAALTAALIPAQRAAATDPMNALRSE